MYEVKSEDFKELENAIREYREGADRKITEYLHTKGYTVLSNSIQNLIPVSNRRKKHAKNQKVLQDKFKNSVLSVTIGAKSSFNYLYFPDDGSNTKNHAGNKHFFLEGIEKEELQIINDLLEELSFKEE